MTIINETLIRLKDCEDEYSLIAAFHTEKPAEFLKLYEMCQKYDIPISISKNQEVAEKYEEAVGNIEIIEVSFGGEDNYPCIDVWIRVW